jgi:hypothetical protein
VLEGDGLGVAAGVVAAVVVVVVDECSTVTARGCDPSGMPPFAALVSTTDAARVPTLMTMAASPRVRINWTGMLTPGLLDGTVLGLPRSDEPDAIRADVPLGEPSRTAAWPTRRLS